jgi:hypothetical protein
MQARVNGARAWRRRFPEAAGEEARPGFAATETRPEEGLETVVVYAVPEIVRNCGEFGIGIPGIDSELDFINDFHPIGA